MTTLLVWATGVMALIFLALVATILIRRFRADRRLRRERAVRPGIEQALAEYLAVEKPRRPPLPPGRREREIVRTIALEEMAELRGRERERLLSLLESSGIVAETAADLGSRRRRVRRAAAEALRQIGSQESTRSLLAGLYDADVDAALTCAAAVAELPDESPIPEVLILAEGTVVDRPGAVAAILVTLGRTHPAAVGQALRPEAPVELRRLAAAVAGELRLAEHVPLLRTALEDGDDELAARAARGLGRIGDSDALGVLIAAVEDPERAWYFRLAATEALGEIGDPRATPPLERELHEDGWMLQAKAARALHLLGASGEEALRRGLASPEEEVREHARVALAR